MLSEATAQNQFWLLLCSIKFLDRQEIQLRGHNHHNGNLWQLVAEKTQSLFKAKHWMLRCGNWMSDIVQNEILQMLVHAIQRKIVSMVMKSIFFGLTSDGTTSNKWM